MLNFIKIITIRLTNESEYGSIIAEVNRLVIFRINYNIPVMFESGGDENYSRYSDRSEIYSQYGEKITVCHVLGSGYSFLQGS